MKVSIAAILLLASVSLHAAGPAACPAVAPVVTPPVAWDNSGNTLLQGKNYYFRYVQYTTGDQFGNLSRAIALYQTISFKTGGSYTINGVAMDSSSSQTTPCAFTYTGSYSLSQSGYGYISNPVNPADVIWGLVSQNGVFVGSTTETTQGYNDFFIGVPMTNASSQVVTNSMLSGTYSVAYLNFPDGYVTDLIGAGFQIIPNGSGSFGTVNIQAYKGNNDAINVPEQASYYFAGGAFVLGFPGFGVAISGQEYLYISPDGSFGFGGAPNGFDIFVGVQTGTGSSKFGGLYYQAGIDETLSTSGTPASVYGALQTYHGAFDAVAGNVISHQRILAPSRSQPNQIGYHSAAYGYTTASEVELAFGSNGGYTDSTTGREYVIGANGTIRIGFGTSPALGISVALQAPPPSANPPSVYINPAGVVNAASSAPFTAGISPGELISIYGSGLMQGTVSVTVGNTPVTPAYVSATQIDVVVPFTVTGPYAQIQVSNSGGSSTVWEPVYSTTLGVFSQPQTGVGNAVAFDGASLITPTTPASAGQAVSIYATGLGAVASFGGTYSPVTTLAVTIGGVAAAAVFPGSSTMNGVNEISVTIPAGLSPGDNAIGIVGPDSQSAQATIFIGAGRAQASGVAGAAHEIEFTAPNKRMGAPIR